LRIGTVSSAGDSTNTVPALLLKFNQQIQVFSASANDATMRVPASVRTLVVLVLVALLITSLVSAKKRKRKRKRDRSVNPNLLRNKRQGRGEPAPTDEVNFLFSVFWCKNFKYKFFGSIQFLSKLCANIKLQASSNGQN